MSEKTVRDTDHISANREQLSRPNAFSFNLVLFSDSGEMKTLWLPKSPDGFYRFTDAPEYRFLSIEARNGQWVACCSRPAFFKNVAPELYQQIPLADNQLLSIECEDRTYVLYAEKTVTESMIFHNYTVLSDVEISIGRLPTNDICCNSRFVTKYHAVLSRFGGKWRIQDCDSTNGVYVNGWRITDCDLKMGDSIFIMGLRILIGSNFISVNNGNDRATISPRILRNTENRRSGHSGYSRYSGQDQPEFQESFFNRSPRKKMEQEEKVITVEAPPLSMERAQMPLMLRMGSSLVMGGNAALAGNFTMLLTSVIFPFLSQKFTDKQRQDYEYRRVTKYQEYLEMKRKEIMVACTEEQKMFNQKYPELNTVISQAHEKVRLWERRPIDDDFLCLRLGRGVQNMQTKIDYPMKRFELEPDQLEEKMYELVEQKYPLSDMPIMSSFTEDNVCGVLGPRNLTLDFARQLIMQTAALHSYDEVKMVFLMSPEDLKQMDFVRYLPHAWDDQRSIRFVATNEAEAYRLGEYIKDQLPEDLEQERGLDRILKTRPYYIVFALEKKLFDSIEILKTVLLTEQNHGISLLAVFDDLPKECVKIFNLNAGGSHYITHLRAGGGVDIPFTLDYCNLDRAMESMKLMANLSLKATSQAYDLPKMITFLEMFQAGRVEHLNPIKRWRENNPVKSLAAPVGVGLDGSLFTLDLHEKRQGPHGLVAGMTGSGKSEFIVTYILSMAINYHPDEVAFILIDYKGGGLAGAFENPRTGMKLPHLVGTITNLDGAAIQRSLMSIESELKRRQRIFNEVKAATNEGTLDIYGYQKLYRAGKVSDPMPHLFIISDEFAELKQQQPEFMEKLISAARIGRSLGVHLILATQKPAGVVNDQIRSNTKFRVCLRVQDRADSMDMLKRPEAAELTDTGRFYLQVGYNEFFALGQSAWCGASYEPQDTVVVQRDDAIEVLDTTGQVLSKTKPKVRKVDSGMKQIVAIVQYLSDWAKREGYQARSLWQEPLPKVLPMDDLYRRYAPPKGRPIQALMGIADDPERQDQYPMIQDVQNCQHLLIVGDSGSGKSTLLQTMLYSLADNYSPEDVNFYIMDFSAKLLTPFKNMPHCGMYLTEEDEGSFNRFFTFLSEEVDRRKKLFAEADVNSYEAYLETHKLPLMLVVIDNLAGLSGTPTGSKIPMHEYYRAASNYGIKFVISAGYINEVPSRSKQELGTRISLHAKDRFAYGENMNKKVTYVPAEGVGRGLCVVEDRPLEFQCAIAVKAETAVEQNALIRARLADIAARYTGLPAAKRLPMLDNEQTYFDFCQNFKPGRIPLGYAVQDVRPVALPLKQLFSLSLYFGNPTGVAPVLQNLVDACKRENMELVIVKRKSGSVFGSRVPTDWGMTLLECNGNDIGRLWDRLYQETMNRKIHRNDYCQRHGIPIATPDDAPNAWAQASDYIRSRTRGLMVIFESFLDFATCDYPALKETFPVLFEQGKNTNYYFTGCFYPDDASKMMINPVMTKFNPDKHVLLFGGRLNSQGILNSLPYEYKNITGVNKQYNQCLMHYQNQIHPMLMPCGALETETADEDAAPIF